MSVVTDDWRYRHMLGSMPSDTSPFTSWATAEKTRPSVVGRPRLSDSSLAMYRSLWEGWEIWLARQGELPWHQVTPADAARFLQGPRPPDRGGGVPRDETRMKRFTANRYFRVVRAVYAHAVVAGQIAENPWEQLDPALHQIHNADRGMQSLEPALWARARSPENMAAYFAQGGRWMDRRDHALVALLFEAGLALSELLVVSPQDFLATGPVPLVVDAELRMPEGGRKKRWMIKPRQADLFDVPGPYPLKVLVPADGKGAVDRDIPIGRAAARVVVAWMEERYLRLREAMGLLAGDHARRESAWPLFISNTVPDGHEAMNDSAMHRVVAGYLSATREAPLGQIPVKMPRLAAPGEAPRAPRFGLGPSVVRNCVIQSWHRELGDEQETLRRAGVGANELPRIRDGALSGGRPTGRAGSTSI